MPVRQALSRSDTVDSLRRLWRPRARLTRASRAAVPALARELPAIERRVQLQRVARTARVVAAQEGLLLFHHAAHARLVGQRDVAADHLADPFGLVVHHADVASSG